MVRILDGKATAAEVRAEVAEGVRELKTGGRPGYHTPMATEVRPR